MHTSIEQLLNQVAQRGSWVGGGSVAALTAASAAALLEKLIQNREATHRLQAIRRECLRLVRQDAESFARVIRATRGDNRRAFHDSLKAAVEIPVRIFTRAQAIQRMCRTTRRSINPRFHSDLRCAHALAQAAGESAQGFIETNLAWLKHPAYARAVRRRLRKR